MHTDGCCTQDAGLHVDEMGGDKESTSKESFGQANEDIIYPKGKEEDEGKISYSQVEHVDMSVCPGVPFGDVSHWAVSQTLKVVVMLLHKASL